MHETEIVAGLRRADRVAFRAAYDAHRNAVLSFLIRLTRCRSLAEDLAQETWVRLARRAPHLHVDTCLRAFLFTVARNLFVSHRRAASLDREGLEQLGFASSDTTSSPLDEASANEARRTIEGVLARLPHDQRESVLLIVVRGFTYEEVVQMTGASEEALRKRVSRARAAISNALEWKGGRASRLYARVEPAFVSAVAGIQLLWTTLNLVELLG